MSTCCEDFCKWLATLLKSTLLMCQLVMRTFANGLLGFKSTLLMCQLVMRILQMVVRVFKALCWCVNLLWGFLQVVCWCRNLLLVFFKWFADLSILKKLFADRSICYWFKLNTFSIQSFLKGKNSQNTKSDHTHSPLPTPKVKNQRIPPQANKKIELGCSHKTDFVPQLFCKECKR